MSNFDSFREKNKQYKRIQDRLATKFITQGWNSIEIEDIVNERKISASVVWNNDTISNAYIFTSIQDEIENGSIIKIGPKYAIILREDFIVKKTDYHKYFALECNVKIENEWGWFKGPGDTYISTNLEKERIILSNQKPLLILSGSHYKIGDKLKINTRPWLIIECDNITSPGVSYYSLEATRMAKEVDESTLIEEIPAEVNYIEVKPEEKIVLSTENGYFSCSKPVTVIKRTNSEITFTIPYGIDQTSITTYVDEQEVVTNYKVVL